MSRRNKYIRGRTKQGIPFANCCWHKAEMFQQSSSQVPSCVYDHSSVLVQDPCDGGGLPRAVPGVAYSHTVPAQRREQLVQITLCDQALWNQFNSIGTEMVLTKAGRRVFPSLRVTFSGLVPCAHYKIMMGVERVDENRYKFQDGRWVIAGKAELPYNQNVFVHPLSSSTGEDIMNKIVSFHKVKLTNSPMKLQNGKFLLHSLHRYQLRVYIARCEIPDDISSFRFAEANFITVTAYQNARLSQLKIANNPFARRFLPGGARRRKKQSRKPKECDLPNSKRLRTERKTITSQREQNFPQMTTSVANSFPHTGNYVENCNRQQLHQLNGMYFPNDISGDGPTTSGDDIFPPQYYCDGAAIHSHSLMHSNTRGYCNCEYREEYPPHNDLFVNNVYENVQWHNTNAPVDGQAMVNPLLIGN